MPILEILYGAKLSSLVRQ